MKDREAKSRAREDKRGWLEQMESETDTYAKNGRTKELYRTAKKKHKRWHQVATVKNKRGETIKTRMADLKNGQNTLKGYWLGSPDKTLSKKMKQMSPTKLARWIQQR